MVLGNAVSDLEMFVWILNHVSSSTTWSLFTLSPYLVMTNLNAIFHSVVSIYRLVKGTVSRLGMCISAHLVKRV